MRRALETVDVACVVRVRWKINYTRRSDGELQIHSHLIPTGLCIYVTDVYTCGSVLPTHVVQVTRLLMVLSSAVSCSAER